jgi:signal peptidase I
MSDQKTASDRLADFNELPGIDDTYFILLALLLAFGSLQTAGTVMETERPVVSVISPSMCPEVQVGDILFVRGSDFSQIQEDDIIVYDVPDRVEMTIDGENHILEHAGDTTETQFGTLKLVDVIPGQDRRNDRIVMQLNGETIERNGDYLREGEGYLFNGNRVEIDYATSLPRGDTPIVHRVVEKHEDHVETMGDANSGQIEFETNVRPEQIYGKSFFKIPRLGLVKIVAMDLIGYQGDRPFVLDATPSC